MVSTPLTVGAFLGRNRKPKADTAATPANAPAGAPHAAALEALSDPLMLVSGTHEDDLTGRMIVFSNAAARELFRLPPEGARLVSALRNPEVLEAIDESLFGGLAREAFLRAARGAGAHLAGADHAAGGRRRAHGAGSLP